MEHFYTIQGEGFYTGHAAYFIRLGGCDVGCVWCDVKESWDADAHPKMSIENMVMEASKHLGKIAVITGGEPLLHDCSSLTEQLISAGLRRHVETSGSSPLSGDWDWICFSPKKFKAPLEEFYSKSHELKIVIFNHHDLEWAETHAKKINTGCKLYLQPEWSQREKVMPMLVDYVKQNPHWQVSLQTHKYLNIP